MKAGLLKHIITIEEPITNRNDYGSQEITWNEVTTTRANIIFNRGKRDSENIEVYYNYTITFTIRHYHNINDYMRIKYNGKYYRILSIQNEPQSITIITEQINE